MRKEKTYSELVSRKKRKFHIVDTRGERAANRGVAYLSIALALLATAILIIIL